MSLSLLQGYSSTEEEEEETVAAYDELSDDYENGDNPSPAAAIPSYKSSAFDLYKSSSNDSGLPSAFDAFSQISGPPTFLNNCVEVESQAADRDADHQQRRHRGRREKKDLPTGAVMEAKAQLVGIRDRVRSDIEGTQPPTSSVSSKAQGEGRRVAAATNPSAEDAAELLRVCLHCGIPKIYSNARGMFCPLCGDRPPTDPSNEPKKKGSTIKEKEKNKRMKGQSSHATWKSETEMQLRQQFD